MNEENNQHEGLNNRSKALSLSLKKLNNLGSSLLIAFAFLVPLFFIPSPFFNFSTGKILFVIAVVAIAFILMTALSLKSGGLSLPKHPLFIAALSIPVVYFISSIFSESGFSLSVAGYGSEVYTFAAITFFFALFFLTLFFFQKNSNVFYFYSALAASSLVLALFFLVRFFAGSEFLSLGFFDSLNSSPVESWTGAGILFGVVFTLALFTHEMFKLKPLFKWLLLLLMLISLFFLVLVNVTWLWITIGAVVLLFTVYKMTGGQQSTEEVGVPILSLVTLFIVVTFVFFGGSLSEVLSGNIGVSSDDLRPSFGATTHVARSTILEEPIKAVLGAGPMDFSYQWMQYKPQEILNTRFWNVEFGQGHSLLSSVPTTVGILGLAAWIVFVVLYLLVLWRGFMTRSFDNDNFTRYAFISSASASLIILVAMFMTLLPVAVLSLFFIFAAISLGVLVREGKLQTVSVNINMRDRKGSLYAVGIIVIAGALVIFSAFLVQRGVSAYFYEKAAYAYLGEEDMEAAEDNFDWAVSLAEQDRYYRTAAEFPIARIREYIGLLENDQITQDSFVQSAGSEFRLAINRARKATDLRNVGYRNWLTLGRIYQEMLAFNVSDVNAYSEAKNAYERAIEHNPKNPALVLQMARFELVNEDMEEARRYTEEALEMKPNYANAMFFKSQLDIRDGNLEEARESVSQALAVEPFDAGLHFQLGILHYEDQQLSEASNAFARAVNLAPGFDNARYFLSLSLYQTEREETAIELMEDLAERYNDISQLVSVLDNMREGEDDPLADVAEFEEPTPELPVEEDVPEMGDEVPEDEEEEILQEDAEDAEGDELIETEEDSEVEETE
ncbi:MAG: tetratricopeptide repeat protein [Patescibacteria group bacterium]